MNIGTIIRNRRKELGMTQEELADKMGYKSKSSINKIELGENDIPQSKIVKFAEALHTTPAHLMGWDQEEIDAASEIQNDANEYFETEENILRDFMLEIADMGFSSNEIENIRLYAHAVKNAEENTEELHTAYIDLFVKMYELGLSIDNLQEIYTYAQFLKSKMN